MKIGILTVSDTRILETDESGDVIARGLSGLTSEEISRKLVRDDVGEIRVGLDALKSVEIVIVNGGTGIAKRDVTFEAVQSLIVTEIPGFGELFRALSFQEIGTHAIASRALAFFDSRNRLIFCLPGSPKACQLAIDKIIRPEIDHLLKERAK
ncbi:MAG: MogA/MoaB family molybdenum cofactor biosynthesis protein [Streptococcaceae bacterium]|jgi:molybdenum cofactor synthesis domain-containing protein|nr:MogA/MoaB family molybdenum cofactor biosynthesis protein [Streptococcaceae bacterium]